ncbi:MAG: PAS domain-containing protein, partial [Chloroflexales bacterium]
MDDYLPDHERFRTIHAYSLDGIALVRNVRDASGSIIDFACEYLNPVAERLVGQSLAQLYGQTMTKVFPGAAENGLLARYFAVAANGEPQIFEQAYAADGLNAWYRNMVMRLDDGLA